MPEKKLERPAHEGHRARLKRKYSKYGAEVLEEHEFLELLLFYAIPYRDTNELAHRLLHRFASFSNVLKADRCDIESLPGMGPSAALYLQALMDCVRTYLRSQSDDRVYSSPLKAVSSQLAAESVGREVESVQLVGLNRNKKVISRYLLARGGISSVRLNRSALYQSLRNCWPAYAVLVHNHPSGIALPSNADFLATTQIMSLLKDVNIPLLDHIILDGKNDYISFADSNFLQKNMSGTSYVVVPPQSQMEIELSVSHYEPNLDGGTLLCDIIDNFEK